LEKVIVKTANFHFFSQSVNTKTKNVQGEKKWQLQLPLFFNEKRKNKKWQLQLPLLVKAQI
jgi:hypothetical protein